MRYYANSRPSHGVAFSPWASRVSELLEEHGLELPPKQDLVNYYHLNLSYEEVLNKMQFKILKNVTMELQVIHETGTFKTHFNTSEQAKEFFKKFPELRKALDEI